MATLTCEVCGTGTGVGLISSETLNANVCDLCNDLDHWIRSIGFKGIQRALKKLEEYDDTPSTSNKPQSSSDGVELKEGNNGIR